MAAKNNEVDDWMEWLDKDEEEKKREDNELMPSINISSGKNEEIQKEILKNNLDDIAEFLDIDETKKNTKELSEIEFRKTKTSVDISSEKKNEKIITLESTPFNTFKECELMANILAKRIEESKAKSVSLERFFSILITASANRIEEKELNSLLKKIQTIIKDREIKKRHKALGKKKPNSEMNVIKNYKDEVDMLYGDLSSSFEDEEEEEEKNYDEYNEVVLEYG